MAAEGKLAKNASSNGAAKGVKNNEANLLTRGTAFFNDSILELKKVTRPTRQETIQATFVVILMMVIVSLYLGVLDLVFNRVMQSILS